jgi:hypothetical protein
MKKFLQFDALKNAAINKKMVLLPCILPAKSFAKMFPLRLLVSDALYFMTVVAKCNFFT